MKRPNPLKIVPVIDILNGVVVRAIAGKRAEYRPIVSQLTTSTDPAEVLRALVDASGSDNAYIADLDAITGQTTVSTALLKLIDQSPSTLSLWIDAGFRNLNDLESLPKAESAKIVPVFGTETLQEPEAITAAIKRFGSAVVSLDFVNGQLLTKAPFTSGDNTVSESAEVRVVSAMKQLGVNQFIVLDLSAVGTGQERTSFICAHLLERFPELSLYPGGGIRNRSDLERFESAGVSGVLVASALHDGFLP